MPVRLTTVERRDRPWQLGIRNEDATRIALEGGLDVVMDRCVKIEHARILGGLNWAGVNTGVISAKRPLTHA